MTCCSGFWMWVGSISLLWWLFTSMVVYYTWNHVVTAVTSARAMQLKHAFLLVFAIACLHAPQHMRKCWKGSCDRVQMKMMDQDNEHHEDEMKLEIKPSK